MKNIILIIAFLFIKNTEATEIKKNIQVSATIVYNCQVIDEKTFKYCDNVQIVRENNTITIKY